VIPPGAADVHVVPLEVNTLPLVPGATTCSALVPLPKSTLFAVNEVAPVPPCATVTAAFVVKMFALALGRVKVFLVEAGPENSVKPFPVPPLAAVKAVVKVKVPDDNDVAVALPNVGVSNVGLVANTNFPVPVSSVTVLAKLALVGEAINVCTPAPNVNALCFALNVA